MVNAAKHSAKTLPDNPNSERGNSSENNSESERKDQEETPPSRLLFAEAARRNKSPLLNQ